MKSLLVLFFSLIPMVIYSQEYLPMDIDSEVVSYKEVVEAKGSKEELFDKAKTWAVKTYNNYQSVSQLEDKESGKIILKGMQNVSASDVIQSRVHYTLTIECKDGRYRAAIDDMYGEDKYTSSWSKKEMWMYNKLLENTLNDINSGKVSKKKLKTEEYLLATYQETIKKINGAMNGILSSLKETVTTEEEVW